MSLEVAFPLTIVALSVFVPLAREYAAFRREWGIGRLAALGTAFTLFPALGIGITVSQPLAARPVVQWVTTIVVTILAYSFATALLRPRLEAEPLRRRSR